MGEEGLGCRPTGRVKADEYFDLDSERRKKGVSVCAAVRRWYQARSI